MINESLLKNEELAVYNLRSLYSGFGYTQYKMSKFEEYSLYVENKDFLGTDKVITFTEKGQVYAEEIIGKINNHPYKAVYVTEKEFENIKNKYINDKKNGIIYKEQEEKDALVLKEKKNSELVDKALNLFGSDLVDIEEE